MRGLDYRSAENKEEGWCSKDRAFNPDLAISFNKTNTSPSDKIGTALARFQGAGQPATPLATVLPASIRFHAAGRFAYFSCYPNTCNVCTAVGSLHACSTPNAKINDVLFVCDTLFNIKDTDKGVIHSFFTSPVLTWPI